MMDQKIADRLAQVRANRPEIDPEKLAEYEAHAEEHFNNPPDDIKIFVGAMAAPGLKELYTEVFICGEWMHAELEARGYNQDFIENFCFTHGRRSFGADPWVIGKKMLDRLGTPEQKAKLDRLKNFID